VVGSTTTVPTHSKPSAFAPAWANCSVIFDASTLKRTMPIFVAPCFWHEAGRTAKLARPEVSRKLAFDVDSSGPTPSEPMTGMLAFS
jgi:hypothetical protein